MSNLTGHITLCHGGAIVLALVLAPFLLGLARAFTQDMYAFALVVIAWLRGERR